MKKKVIVIGTGEKFIELSKFIDEQYNILAVADNKHLLPNYKKWRWISIEEVPFEEYEKIILCVKSSGERLRQQLINLGVKNDVIISIEEIYKIQHQKDIEKYESDKKQYITMYYDGEFLKNFKFDKDNEYSMLSDYRDSAGTIDGHYFWQDILVAREIIQNNPKMHYDIASRIDGLISHLITAGINITIIDIRPLEIENIGYGLASINFIQGDATKLENINDNSINSISTCHAYKHFGLGRYGDSINPNACFDAMKELQRVLSFEGKLYFSIPVGKNEKLCFNAHRIFNPKTIINVFNKLKLEKMYLIHNMEVYEYNEKDILSDNYKIIGDYDCGIFIFSK